MAVPGRVMCEECAKKDNERTKENRKALINIGICPRCGKNKLWGDEKMCLECKEKMYEYNKTHRTKSHKNYNKIRKDNGMCIKCGKNAPVPGKTKCALCAQRERTRAREYRMRKGIEVDRWERPAYGKCYICGAEITSGRICKRCKDRIVSSLSKGNKNSLWERDNALIFKSMATERRSVT